MAAKLAAWRAGRDFGLGGCRDPQESWDGKDEPNKEGD